MAFNLQCGSKLVSQGDLSATFRNERGGVLTHPNSLPNYETTTVTIHQNRFLDQTEMQRQGNASGRENHQFTGEGDFGKMED